MILRDTNIKAALRARKKQKGFLLNPFRFSGGAPTTDPHWDKVVLLAHMDGTDGGTTFIDSGPLGLSATSNNVTTRPGSAYYGTAGAQLLGASANNVTFSHASAFNFASSEAFTIEVCARLERSTSSYSYDWLLQIASVGENHNKGLYMRWSDGGFGSNLQCAIADTQRVNGFPRSSAYNNYATIAYCRRPDSTCEVFVNGISIGITTNGNAVGGTAVRIGCAMDGSYPLRGSVDEVRITKGVCRYSANYTPATEAFPNG